MRSRALLLQLQVFVFFVLMAKLTIAEDGDKAIEISSILSSKPKRSVAGNCADGKGAHVDTTKHWMDRCYDIKGNSYKIGNSLLSCCGCFKFICNITKDGYGIDAKPASWPFRKFMWDKILEDSCCQDCEGNVFSSGSVMKVENFDDRCSTTATTTCVFLGKEKKAVIEETLSFGECCTNSSGIYPIGTYMPIPETCSIQKCLRPDGRHEASWIITQIEKGCNCCIYQGKLVPSPGWVIISNGINATCCEGRLLVSPEDVQFPDEECFHEDTNITFHDLGRNQYGQDTKPAWIIDQGGRRLTETKNTRPSVGVTDLGDSTRPVKFTGKVYSNNADRDVIGMVFGYHNETNFFVVASAGRNRGPTNWYVGRLHARCGSSCAATTTVSNAIWNPSLYPLDITVLASGTNFWVHPNIYRFSICFNPVKLLIDVTITDHNIKQLATGIISGETGNGGVDALSRLGGHIGVYVDSQEQTVWDQLDCTDCKITEDVLPIAS